MKLVMAVFKSKLALNTECVVYDNKVWFMIPGSNGVPAWFYSNEAGKDEHKLPYVAGREETFEPFDPDSVEQWDYVKANFPSNLQVITDGLQKVQDDNSNKKKLGSKKS